MKTTRLLLAGLLTGAMAVGTACKTDESQRMPNTPPTAPSTTMSTDAGTGGAGYEPTPTLPPSNGDVRDREPDMPQVPLDQPGTGGSGMNSNDMHGPGTVGDDNIDNPLPQPPPIDSTVKGDMPNTVTPPSR